MIMQLDLKDQGSRVNLFVALLGLGSFASLREIPDGEDND
jgi:hypothetical protein